MDGIFNEKSGKYRLGHDWAMVMDMRFDDEEDKEE